MWFLNIINRVRAGLSVCLILLLLTLAPFAVAQDVHHELAAADIDGHEHSDNDLCQWVQHHTSGSIDLGGPVFSAWEIVSQYDHPPQSILLSVEFVSVGPSRAPPSLH
jgi:hypothetical protein